MQYGGYPELKAVKKILVIKLRHLGDVLLSTPVFSALKEAIPDALIDTYIYKEAEPMLQGHPDINQIILADRKSEIRRLWKIRKEGYDLVINLTEGDRGVIAALVSGAKIRVGFRPKGKWQQKVLTHIAKDCPSLRHMVERNLDVIRRIGIFPKKRELFFHIPDDAFQRVPDSFVLIHPTSRWRFKCWPALKMRQLVQWLIEHGKKVVLTSGPDPIEIEMVKEIAKDLDVLNLAGTLILKELGAFIQKAEFLVCVDSVSFHLASALKKPVVALFGPTSDVTWGPWQNPHAEIIAMKKSCRPCYLDGCGGSKRSDCLDSLDMEAVLQSKIFTEIRASCNGIQKKLLNSAIS